MFLVIIVRIFSQMHLHRSSMNLHFFRRHLYRIGRIPHTPMVRSSISTLCSLAYSSSTITNLSILLQFGQHLEATLQFFPYIYTHRYSGLRVYLREECIFFLVINISSVWVSPLFLGWQAVSIFFSYYRTQGLDVRLLSNLCRNGHLENERPILLEFRGRI